MIRKIITILLATLLVGVIANDAFADSSSNNPSRSLDGRVYTFSDDEPYDYLSAEKHCTADFGVNTYGAFSVEGNLTPCGVKNGFPAYAVSGNVANILYSYTDDLLVADEYSWHLVEDKSKEIGEISLDSKMKKGAMILQSSKDGELWFDEKILLNCFEETPVQNDPLYSINAVQLANGCYFRLIVAWECAFKTGENNGILGTGIGKTDTFDYKRTAEVYEFYLYDEASENAPVNTLSRNLGSLTKTGFDNGYSGNNEIGIKDAHYGWEIGQFFVSGYTRATEQDGTPIFLKNAGDQITLWFNLQQDIDKLNDDEKLSISDDKNGYDQYFGIQKTDLGRGALIVRYTDERGVKHEPEIYTNYLAANATTGADTVVKLFEEGDYEVALDYEIKTVNTKIAGVEILPEFSNYRVFFKFSVRNGNCMVFPFDIVTGAELSHCSITENGFILDMAKSKYLVIDVQRSVVSYGAAGYVEDVRFNRPAKDGDKYTDEGIYTFNVKNLYTGESTIKTLYVGDSDCLLALSVNKLTVDELNIKLGMGGVIEKDGTISMSITENVQSTELPSQTDSEDTLEPEPSSSTNLQWLPVALGVTAIAVIAVAVAVILKNAKRK